MYKNLPFTKPSELQNVELKISDNFNSIISESKLVLSSRIEFIDQNLYDTLGWYFVIWIFDISNSLEFNKQLIFNTKSMDNFLYPSGFKDTELTFFYNILKLYSDIELPFQKHEKNIYLQSLQTNNGIYSLIEVGETFNKTQIITLNNESNDFSKYVHHLGADNNLKKYLPDYVKPKETSIIDYIRMKGFDEEEKFLKIEKIIDLDENRLLVIIFHRKYSKNPLTSTNKNSPFFYLFIDKKTNGITGFLKFVKDLKPFKNINFFNIEISPYLGENLLAFSLNEFIIYKSLNSIILFDKNGNINKTISLTGKNYSKIRKMKLIGANQNSFYLLDLDKEIILDIVFDEELEIKLETINMKLK